MSEVIIDVLQGRVRDLGDGDTVRRVLPIGHRQMVGPFIFFDHMGPWNFAPGRGTDVRPHPHIGLATVTYLFDGAIDHRDSLGSVQAITPGDLNWMTAGRGIVHSERSPSEARTTGARVHGIQAWVALPLEAEQGEPRFEHYPASKLPYRDQAGVQLRVIAGSAYGMTSPANCASPTFYVEAKLRAGTTLELPQDYSERALYVVAGRIAIADRTFKESDLPVFAADARVTLRAEQDAHLMLLGGEPVGARKIWWNFVASSDALLEQAKADWLAQRFDKVPGETEFIPLPAPAR